MKVITNVDTLRGRSVIVRASLNVPIVDGAVTSRYRIMQALPTLRYLHEAGARVTVLAHIGRALDETLAPVADILNEYLPVQWGGAIGSEDASARHALLGDGDILLLENTRQHAGEMACDDAFVSTMAQYGELFVFDAFAVAHREHASVTGLAARLPTYAGLLLAREVTALQRAFAPTSPSLFMLGGAKFETKLPLIEKFMGKYQYIFVGGAIMNDVMHAAGYAVGRSILSKVTPDALSFVNDPSLVMPVDVVVADENNVSHVRPVDGVLPTDIIYDVGPKTVAKLRTIIADAGTILWNGPFGYYEGGYTDATEAVAKLVAASSATSVVGGGDTVASIESLAVGDQFSHVSTGGGAMLAFLETGTLPILKQL